jgi:hypothetical protein
MDLTYTWEIIGIGKRNSGPIENAIVQTNWKVTGTNSDNFSGSFIGATPFDLNTVDPNNFIPYEDLTEEIVLSWIQNLVENDRVYKDHINRVIMKEIDSKSNPVTQVIDGFPWKPGEEVTPPVPED